ncbi:hypothetical protein OF83DRAFT_1144071 [Amylostereum chailletii]|nr:hypothetical protein OF83DRAFT_1144071 [Amylostereum chailletii]
MADSENIFDAVASALHQRRVGGVMQPMVGLAFDTFETTVQVVFDSVQIKQHSVPLPRVAYAAPSSASSREREGVFDLRDIHSAEMLVAFLIDVQASLWSARSHGSAVAHGILEQPKRTGTKFPLWRSDAAGNLLVGTEAEDLGDRWRDKCIGLWAEGVKDVLDPESASDFQLHQQGSFSLADGQATNCASERCDVPPDVLRT